MGNKSELQKLLEQTVRRKATDLHICPGALPFVRVNGELVEIPSAPLDVKTTKAIIDELLEVEQKNNLHREKRLAFTFSVPALGRFRANAYSQRGSYAIAIRSLPFEMPDFHSLGLSDTANAFVGGGKGLYIVAGPAGSGKSTTMAAIVNHLNGEKAYHITTIESPIEFLHRHKKSLVTQREIGADAPDIKTALSWALCEDSDVIVLSGADAEALPLILAAAESKPVYITLNASGAAKAIGWFVDESVSLAASHMTGADSSLLHVQAQCRFADALGGIISQRLVPCTDTQAMKLTADVIIADTAAKNLIRDGKYSGIMDSQEKGAG